eukprot:gene26530-biopygen16771
MSRGGCSRLESKLAIPGFARDRQLRFQL